MLINIDIITLITCIKYIGAKCQSWGLNTVRSTDITCQQFGDNATEMYLATVRSFIFPREQCFGRQSGVQLFQVVVLTYCSDAESRESEKISLIILN